ncbi:MAG: DUF1573 domain-containing protein [Chloroflexia bacterium]
MSTRKTQQVGKKAVAPVRKQTAVVRPQARRKGGTDRFGIYFVAGATAAILLFGAAVWGLRGINNSNRADLARPTPTEQVISTLPTYPAATAQPGEKPLPSPTLAAPDAARTGAFAPASPITSVVTDVNKLPMPPHLPPQIPQPHLDVSEASFDLGTPDAGAVITREVTLANSAAGVLTIRGLASDCTCLTAVADATRLPSGTRTRLVLTYTAAAETGVSGPVQHLLSVISTDGQTPRTDVDLYLMKP